MSSSTNKLTLCLQSCEDLDLIEESLRSLRGSVDEIVVVSAGVVDDKMVELVSEYGGKIYPGDPDDGAGMIRNMALEKATGDWILWLEPGETLAAADAKTVRSTTVTTSNSVVALVILHGQDPVTGETDADGHCADPRGVLSGSEPRLFRRVPELRFDVAGELIVPPSIDVFAGDIHIRTQGFLAGQGKNTREAEQLSEEASKLLDDGQMEEAEQLLREARRATEGLTPLAGTITRNLAFALIHQGRSRAALKELKDATDIYPDFTDLYYLTGLAFYDLEDYTPAIKNFEFCLTRGDAPPQYGGWDGVGGYRSQREMGEAFLSTGNAERAEQYFRAALGSNPSDGFSLEGLGELLLSRLNSSEALDELETIADFKSESVLHSAIDLFGRTQNLSAVKACEEKLKALTS